ncbi:MAG: SRPBCC domain-containing protein [bacterium]|nr:SRPBCC domain-containing protein [bacterium]
MTADVTAPIQTEEALRFSRTVNAPLEQVYQAFTDRDAIAYWFVDDAHLRPQAGGHFLLAWGTGYFATGTFAELEANKRIVLNWRGAGESTDSRIAIDLDERDGATSVDITYTGFHPEAAETIRSEWETRLDNLKLVLEDGQDGRVTRRVILGIYPENVTDEEREALGLAAGAAMKVGGLIDGYSAQAAGLETNDIIVAVNGEDITQQRPSFAILGGNVPGDEVEVVFYRSGEKHTRTVALKGYPIPAKVESWAQLADRVEAETQAYAEQIAGLIEGGGEEAASKKATPDEWSAKQVLAHLILHERWLHSWLGGFVQNPETAGYPCNHPALIAGVEAAFPTAADVVAEYRRMLKQTVGILRAFNENGPARKTHLWWANFEFDTLRRHTEEHITQIRTALGA